MTFIFCEVCGGQVILTERHVTVTRNVEVMQRGAVTVLDSEVISRMHLTCSRRVVPSGGATGQVTS